MTALPLEGLRVVDLSRLLPGPYATLVLADLGAEVIKVEAPDGGDYLRWMPPLAPAVKGRSSWAFQALNTGKRSVCLDLKIEAGRQALVALIKTADILLESFRPGVMDRLGLGYGALSAHNPRLIYCAISGYGQDGPMAAVPGHDLNYVALSGALALSGPADDTPSPLPVQLADISGSLWAVTGILAALEGRHRTGTGRFVDVSMTETASSFLATAFAPALNGVAGRAPRGTDVLTGGQACYRAYPCRDGAFFSLASLEPKFWATFCALVERPDWRPRQFDPALGEEIAALFASRDSADWTALLSGTDACAEPVLNFDAWRAHPLTEARDMVLTGEDGMARLRTPVTPRDARPAPAPQHGEHTREVLAELGFDRDAIDRMIESGAIV